MRIGGVNIEDGVIKDFVIETLSTPPQFDASKIGQFTFSISDKVLRFNTGESLVALTASLSENPNLISALGSNWLNEDLSFNPTDFNELSTITGLTTNDSLFDVIAQIDDALSNISNVTIEDIDVSEVVASDMSVLAILGGDLLFVTIEQVLEGSTISLNFDNLDGFNITDTTTGNMVIFKDDELVSKTTHFYYENLSQNGSHLITHNLGFQFCSVFCINPATKQSIIPTNIQFISNDELIVTLPSSQPLIAIVTNFNP